MARAKHSDTKWVRRFSELQSRLVEAEDTLNAIRNGTVDALVVRTPRGEQLFTLKGADQTYRVLVEGMNEGALTLRHGIISYCNNRFAEMSRTPMEKSVWYADIRFCQCARTLAVNEALGKRREFQRRSRRRIAECRRNCDPGSHFRQSISIGRSSDGVSRVG